MAVMHLPSVLKWVRHEGLVRGLSKRVTSVDSEGIEEGPREVEVTQPLAAGVNEG